MGAVFDIIMSVDLSKFIVAVSILSLSSCMRTPRADFCQSYRFTSDNAVMKNRLSEKCENDTPDITKCKHISQSVSLFNYNESIQPVVIFNDKIRVQTDVNLSNLSFQPNGYNLDDFAKMVKDSKQFPVWILEVPNDVRSKNLRTPHCEVDFRPVTDLFPERSFKSCSNVTVDGFTTVPTVEKLELLSNQQGIVLLQYTIPLGDHQAYPANFVPTPFDGRKFFDDRPDLDVPILRNQQDYQVNGVLCLIYGATSPDNLTDLVEGCLTGSIVGPQPVSVVAKSLGSSVRSERDKKMLCLKKGLRRYE